MLCHFCERITIAGLKSDKGYRHAPSFKSLRRSARQDCSLCALFEASLISKDHGIDNQVVLRYDRTHCSVSISSRLKRFDQRYSPFEGQVALFVPYG
jgi:hypothetical protein